MLVIQSVEYNKNPMNINDVFLVQLLISEILATWDDIDVITWGSTSNITWQDANRKIF